MTGINKIMKDFRKEMREEAIEITTEIIDQRDIKEEIVIEAMTETGKDAIMTEGIIRDQMQIPTIINLIN